MGYKALSKLLNVSLPRNVKELQSVMGKLNFASQFIPDYKRVVKPLKALMSQTSDGRWTQECTDTLNYLVQQVLLRVKLSVVDM